MQSSSRLVEILTDPLCDVARKERRILLTVSIVAIFIAKTGVNPQEIAALWIKLGPVKPNAFLVVMAFVVLYHILAFFIYGLTDFFVWRAKYIRSYPRDQTKDNCQLYESIKKNNNDGEELFDRSWFQSLLYRRARSLAILRIIFEFPLPVFVGVYAIFSLVIAVK